MNWKWSIKKIATDDTQNPTQPKPVNQVAKPPLTPVVQGPQQPPPAAPVKKGPLNIATATFEELMASDRVANLTNFVKRNLTENEDDYCSAVVAQYQANPEAKKFFDHIAKPIVEASGQQYDVFFNRISGKGAINEVKDQQSQIGYHYTEGDEDIANNLISGHLHKLEEFGNNVLGNWIQAIAKMKNPNNAKLLAPEAMGIAGALHDFLFGKGVGGAVKWKTFFKNHSELLPDDVRKHIKKPGSSVYKAINQSIYEYYQVNDDAHPCVAILESLISNNDEIILNALQECARALGSSKGSSAASLDVEIGDKGTSMSALTQDVKAVDPAQDEPKFSENDSILAEQIIDSFLSRNPQFMDNLKNATYPGETIPMTQAILEQAQGQADGDPEQAIVQLLNSALRYPITGVVYSKDDSGKETTNPDYNKWNDFYMQNESLLPSHLDILLNPDDMQNHSTELLQNMLKPEAQSAVDNYMGDPAKQTGQSYEYLKNLYEKAAKLFKPLRTMIPGVGDIKQISRIGKMSQSAVYRDYQYALQKGANEGTVDTLARGYALIRARTKSITKLLLRLMNTHDVIPVSDNKYIYRNENDELMIKEKVDGKKGNKKIKWTSSKITDENFEYVREAMENDWFNDVFQTILGKDTSKHELNRPSALARGSTKDTILQKWPLAENFAKAFEAGLQSPEHINDRAIGYRKYLAQILNEKVQNLSTKVGKQLNANDIFNRIQAIRSGKVNVPTEDDIRPGSQKDKKYNARSGARIRKPEDIDKMLKGIATPYDEESMIVLAKALNTFPTDPNASQDPQKVLCKDIYAPNPLEYDNFNYNDRTDIGTYVPHVFYKYSPYLVHRKREALRRGVRDDFFTDRSLWCFMKLMLAPSFTSKYQRKPAFMLSELTNKTPLNTDQTWDEIQQNMDAINPATGKPFMTQPDIYDEMDWEMPGSKRYFPNPNHPLGYDEKYVIQDREKLVKNIAKNMKSDPDSPFHSLQEFKDSSITKWKNDSQDNSADTLKTRLNQHENPIDIAVEILKSSNPNVPPMDMLENRMNTYNALLQRLGKKHQFDINEFATKFVNDTISNKTMQKDNAKDLLSRAEKLEANPNRHILDEMELYIPSIWRKKWSPKHNKNMNYEIERPEKIKEQANSTKAEEYESMLQQGQSPIDIAKYILTSTGVAEDKILPILEKKFNQFNQKAPQLKKTPFATLDEYAKHYVDEVIRLEKYYRDIAKERLNNPGAHERFSHKMDVLLKISNQLSQLDHMQSSLKKFGRSQQFMQLVNWIVDSGIAELNE